MNYYHRKKVIQGPKATHYTHSTEIPYIFRVRGNEGPASWLISPAGFELAYSSSEDVRTVSCYP